MEELKEVLPFLSKDARLDLKVATLQTILGLTGSKEGLELISSLPDIVRMILHFDK